MSADARPRGPGYGAGVPAPIDRLVGVYHADGGPIGELRYVLGRLLGTAHCGLCDITHSPVRRKPAWEAMVARIGLPFALVHLNEMSLPVAAAIAVHGPPAVLAQRRDGRLECLLGPGQLDAFGGSVGDFEVALRSALAGNHAGEAPGRGEPTGWGPPDAPPSAVHTQAR